MSWVHDLTRGDLIFCQSRISFSKWTDVNGDAGIKIPAREVLFVLGSTIVNEKCYVDVLVRGSTITFFKPLKDFEKEFELAQRLITCE